VFRVAMGNAISGAGRGGVARDEIDLRRDVSGRDEIGGSAEPELIVELAVGVESALEQLLEAVVGLAAKLDLTEGVLRRLLARGKLPKVALIACMRKLLTAI
jgi:hypothetical protein